MVDPGRFLLLSSTTKNQVFPGRLLKMLKGHLKDFAMGSRYPKIPRIPNILMPRSRGNVIPDGQPSIKARGKAGCWFTLDASGCPKIFVTVREGWVHRKLWDDLVWPRKPIIPR